MEKLTHLPRHITKRGGEIDEFNPLKIRTAIFSAVNSVHLEDPEKATQEIYESVLENLAQKNGEGLKIDSLQKIIIQTAEKKGYPPVAYAYRTYSKERDEIRELKIRMNIGGNRSTTDAALMIESDSQETLTGWERNRIVDAYVSEERLARNYAEKLAKKVENTVFGMFRTGGIERFTTGDIRNIADLVLKQEGLEKQKRRQSSLSIPTADLESLVFSKNKENSNVASNNPEAVNLGIAELIQKKWALETIFSKDVADAHFNGEIHIHDLGYPCRAYCSSHSVEYIKKFGLGKVLGNLESKSSPPKSAAVLNQHMQTFLASLQAYYAGALGFGFLNILYSPLLNRPVDIVKGKFRGAEMTFEKRDLEKHVEAGIISLEKESWDNYFEVIEEKKELREVSQGEYDQVAQNLIFAASQNAFSRGGQTLFIDFNIHTGVPNYLKNVPAIGPDGKYIVKMPDNSVTLTDNVPRIKTENASDITNGDAFDNDLEGILKGGHIITYGDLELTSQKFAKSMLEVWRKGDKDGRPFHFPKCDLHVDSNSFEMPSQYDVLKFATQVTAENGSVYFMFDRGDGAVLAQCCRLKERIEDSSMLKYPEKLRFCGFQNVTINIPQAAYRGGNLEGTLENITNSMNFALKAHLEKAEFMQGLLDEEGTPMRNLGRLSDDGEPYIDLKKSTYIIGNIGLNEAVQVLTGKQIHEDEKSYRIGLQIIAHMHNTIKKFKEKTGLKFTIEETPAESTTRRLAMLDKRKYDLAKKVVKGTDENPYYTNSIHFSPDADVGIVDRIEGQSRFHDMIESGAIVHAWIGEQRPNNEAIGGLVKQTLERTRCSQLVFSPTYTECDGCGNIMVGEKELCTNLSCNNSSDENLDKNTIHVVTKIVGYNSRIDNWNGSQKQIYEDRKIAEKEYAGFGGRDMSWLYNPDGHEKLTIIQFAKHNCQPCAVLKRNIEQIIHEKSNEGNVDFRIHYLDTSTIQGLEEAAMYNMPLDTFPSVVVAGKNDSWSKITDYNAINSLKCESNSCQISNRRGDGKIRPKEIREAIKERISDYQPTEKE